MKVTAKATRSGGWWAVQVPEVAGVFTQARRLDQVPEAVADAVAAMLDIDSSTVEVEVAPVLDDEVASLLEEVRTASAEAAVFQFAASTLMRVAVTHLRESEELTTRDVAALLGVSPQRVSQLAAKSASVHDTKEAAIAAARDLAKRDRVDLIFALDEEIAKAVAGVKGRVELEVEGGAWRTVSEAVRR